MKSLFPAAAVYALLTVTPLFSPPAYAATILDTASGIGNLGGAILRDTNWPFHPFELTASTTIQQVGGYFSNNTTTSQVIFGAIISLTAADDLPDSVDFSTPDLIDTTLITIGTTDSIYLGNLALTLSPGFYALAFGTDAFGASSGIDNPFLTMPFHENDQHPLFPYIALQSSHPTGPDIVALNNTPRFIITAEATAPAIPVPATAWLFFSGLLSLTGIAARKHRQPAPALH